MYKIVKLPPLGTASFVSYSSIASSSSPTSSHPTAIPRGTPTDQDACHTSCLCPCGSGCCRSSPTRDGLRGGLGKFPNLPGYTTWANDYRRASQDQQRLDRQWMNSATQSTTASLPLRPLPLQQSSLTSPPVPPSAMLSSFRALKSALLVTNSQLDTAQCQPQTPMLPS